MATTSPSNTPTKFERRNKQVSFFNTISGCSSFFLAKCRTSLLCLLNLFLCHAPSNKSFGIQNMYLCMRCLKDRNHIVQQRWALQQKVAKAIADKRCSVAGLLPLITQVKASCQEAHRLRAGKHFTLVVHLVRDCALERAKRARVRPLPSPTIDAHWITMCTSLLHSISNKEKSFSKDPPPPRPTPDRKEVCLFCDACRGWAAFHTISCPERLEFVLKHPSAASTDSDSDPPSSDYTFDGSILGSDGFDSSHDSSVSSV